ncbi:hypothetical protein G6O67_000730 [Ophiocordyceps sinensis]|uniref:Tr-type G domain-containing protein n=1 Tax=Ophiocordyceps sinensis TaxID=72228 RepID=A0A8H4PZQ4_9HYPO|nr:hypothetical protein G6O67_000730 [Ophiocordyceps sinensis]
MIHRTIIRGAPAASTCLLKPHLALRGCPRWLHGHTGAHDSRLEDIRNIGIIAHVDAGKTTTTERMLYYSGVTQRVGDVDSGNTVTDFLELERERGITIQSAAITFHWPLAKDCPPGTQPKTVNLIDTPGHQDFRFEVDRCLPILDGAVCIIDSVKGVEAHTERVWASAHEFSIPRIVYCNKLDREGASFKKSVLEVGARLKGWPLVCQIPWWEKEEFVGVVDVIDGVGYRWKSERHKIRYGPKELKEALSSSNRALLAEAQLARQHLIEGLAEFDEVIMDEFLAEKAEIPASLLKQAIKRAIREGDGRLIPVFAGSSFRHIGVEPLMDAIAEYLPCPSERPDVEVRLGPSKHRLGILLREQGGKGGRDSVASVASVFKVFNHPKEGVISFVRVYHGTLTRNASTFNTNMMVQERPMGILQVSASKTQEVQELSVGQIGALKGLKKARSGDTLVTTKGGKPLIERLRHIQVRPPEIPPPVAFLQVDPYGNVAAQQLQMALENASREDPSLRWTRDPKTDQFTVQGMGKLHLDVSLYNMRQRHKIDAEFGQIEVDYKECVTTPTEPQYAVFDRPIASKPGRAACTVTLEPIYEHQTRGLREHDLERDGNVFDMDIPVSGETAASLRFDVDEARQQLLNGAMAGLARGPRRASPVHGCHVKLALDTSDGALDSPSGGHFSSAARTAVQAALRGALDKGQIGILEPMMLAHITCPEAAAGTVQHDITAGAGGHILEVTDRSAESTGDDVIDVSKIYAPPDPYESVTSLRGKRSTSRMVEIVAKVPYKEMLNYDDHLRSKTAGRHSMTMSFDSFAKVVGNREIGL